MKKRRLRDLTVSEIGMGCMSLSHGYGRIPERDYSIEAIRKAASYGCTLFDTAESYGSELYYKGHNEEILGEALADMRSDVVIATKFRLKPEDYEAGADLYDSVKGHLISSIKNLRTDYVDLYYLHRIDDHVPVENVAEVMGRLIKEGLIRGWGVSQVSVQTLDRANNVTPVTAVQNLYNIVERDCEKDIFPYCIEHDIGVVPFSPISSGLLSGSITVDTEFEKIDDIRRWVPQLTRENIAANQPIISVIREFAEEKGATCAQISLAWMLHKYPNAVPIPGSKNQDRIIENLESDKVSMTDDEFAEFEHKLAGCKIYGHRGHVEEIPSQGFLKKKPLR